MNLSNPSAYLPFMADAITIRDTRKSDCQPFTVFVAKACVMDADSAASILGLANGWQTAVIFRTSDYADLPTRGATVDPDPNGRWSKLTVQKSYRQSGLTFLLCSTMEGAKV